LTDLHGLSLGVALDVSAPGMTLIS
jgi:hypothetical protein